MSSNKLNFRAPQYIEDELKKRGGLSDAIRDALSRYFKLLDMGRASIIGRFTDGELSLLCDIPNTTMLDANMLGNLWMEADDAEQPYYAKWGVDRAALVEKLKSLNPHQEAALVDAIERYWLAVEHGMQVDPATILG